MVEPVEALWALSLLIGWNGGEIPVYLDGGEVPVRWLDLASLARGTSALAECVERWDRVQSRQVEIGLPQMRGVGEPTASTILWVWAESRESVKHAVKRRPAPTMVLRMGMSCRRLLIWSLREIVPAIVVEASNRRLSYALHAPYVCADPDKLRVPVPGTFLRVGRKRPVPVLTTLVETDRTYWRKDVVGRLRDPPRPYIERLRAGEIAR
jgi:hypothetical protein